MKKIFALFLLVLGLNDPLYSQCNPYYNLKEGTVFEMESYNAKDKKTGRVVNQVKEYKAGVDLYEAQINSTSYDDKDKEQTTGEYTISCKNGILGIDMKSYIPDESMQAYENMDFVFTGDYLEIPANLVVGEKLKDGAMKMEVKAKDSGGVIATIDLKIIERKVEGKETVTTSVGTFDCYKITYTLDIANNMMGINIPMKMQGIDYVAEKVGVVRTESYNKKGKLQGYTLLTRYK